MFRFAKLSLKLLLLLLCLILLCIAIVLYDENRKINLGDNYYLEQFSPDERWYTLHSRRSEEYISTPAIGIIDYYKTKDYYIPYGLSIKLCDKQGLYYLWDTDKYYYVIHRRSGSLDILNGDKKFEIFRDAHNLDLKAFSIPETFMKKIRLSHAKASTDGCLYD